MNLVYTLEPEDYLAYQLYASSKSDRINKKRKNEWIGITISSFLLGFLFFSSSNSTLGIYFLIVGVITLIFFPVYSRRRYRNHYKKYVEENYKGSVKEEVQFEIKEETINVKDRIGESKINLKEIEGINEIGTHFFIKLTSNQSLIIPKRDLIGTEFAGLFPELSKKLQIQINSDLNWKFR